MAILARSTEIDCCEQITDAVHAKGSYIYAQLWALGRQAYPTVLQAEGFEYVGASDIPLEDKNATPRALTVEGAFPALVRGTSAVV